MYVPSNPLYTSVVTLSEFTLLILQFIDHVTHVVNPFSAPWYIQTIIYFFGGFFCLYWSTSLKLTIHINFWVYYN